MGRKKVIRAKRRKRRKPQSLKAISEKNMRIVLRHVRQGIKPYKLELDLTKVPVHFTAHVFGVSKHRDDLLSILVQDCSGKYVKPLGALRIKRSDWWKMKKLADMMLIGHARARRKFAQQKK